MNSLEIVLTAMRSIGRQDAQDLRARAPQMDGTAIIAEEQKIPVWDGEKDYSGWPVGAPVREGEQIYTLLQPHNAAHYPDSTPGNTPALWSITHTKDPIRAKPYAAPSGTSGMYMAGECCQDSGGAVYLCLADNTAFSPEEYPQAWEAVTDAEEG